MVEPGRNSPDRPHTGQLVTAAQEKQQNSPNQISLLQFKLLVARLNFFEEFGNNTIYV
jgi:hypothetical protein